MSRCPNDTYKRKFSNDSKEKNQIGRKFSDIFNILLNPNYYEGTPYGYYFRDLNENHTSKIYIKDPLEEKMMQFCNEKVNTINYLVGFTGMGKTTLIKNFFKINDRDVKIDGDSLVIYISFYYAKLNSDAPQESIENIVCQYFSRAIALLGTMFPELVSSEDAFWNGLFEYIELNKPTDLECVDITPKIQLSKYFMQSQLKDIEQKKDQLVNICRHNRLDYYSNMLKYMLVNCGKISKVYFIMDDIETKEGIFHRPAVEVARHVHSCLSCLGSNNILIKTLVSLRAYTFRSNIDRQLEARRELIEKNTIFKDESVPLSKIFEKRFEELQRILKTKERAKSKESYENAVKQVYYISRLIGDKCDSILIKLANCNLCNAMIMLNSLFTNITWFGGNEIENNGSFRVSAENYRITAKIIFNAIACGNENTYLEKYNNFFPNILHNGKEEGAELTNLLVLRYLTNKKATDLYGETYVSRCDIIQDISRVFIRYDNSDTKSTKWEERVTDSLNYLYDNGVLLRSIYDIENINDDLIERKYSRAFKVYISPRGKYLMGLFSQNALLLELYRDSIYVDLEKNDQLTQEMRTADVIKYLVSYVTKLFEYEKKNIGEALWNLKTYQDYFGNELLVSPLLEGIVKNMDPYFQDECCERTEIDEQISSLIEEINRYISIARVERGIEFKLSDVCVKYMK